MKTNLKSIKCKKKFKKKQKGFNQKKFKRWNLKKKGAMNSEGARGNPKLF
jgi:hypothetical protein